MTRGADRPPIDPASVVLPEDYSTKLKAGHLAPLWSSLRKLIPYERPQRRMRPAIWRYADVRPLLMESGDIAPVELAERRVLALCNPGYPDDSLRATPSIFVGLQLLRPGETASNHRHVASALRWVVEGSGAHTTVEGQPLPMEPGDLILTPGGSWHEHGHEGREPVIWMDALDVPLIYHLEASTSDAGDPQRTAAGPDASQTRFRRGGLVPYGELHSADPYPLLRYPWRETRPALEALARATARQEAVQLAYVNPLTGAECLPTLGCSVLMLRPGEHRPLRRRSASAVLHVLEGRGDADIDGVSLEWSERDILAIPTYSVAHIANRSSTSPAFVFIVDDAPLQRRLNVYREWPTDAS